jgi:hypothetical protein
MSDDPVATLIEEITQRIDRAVHLARRRIDDDPAGPRRAQYRMLADNLAAYKAALLAGKLPPPGTGAGWGAGRAISEWDLDDDELSVAVEAAESLYRNGR